MSASSSPSLVSTFSNIFSSFGKSISPSIVPLSLAAFTALLYKKYKPTPDTYQKKLPPIKSNNTNTITSTDEVKLNSDLLSIELDEKEFISLLDSMMKHSEKLQNSAPVLFPQEDLIANIVVDFLKPYSTENGGPLIVQVKRYVNGRANIIIQYNSIRYPETKKIVSFVGSHMDVVPANAADWNRNPFKLTVEGDNLYGRGVTDCLGHVAMLSCMFKALAVRKIALDINVACVFIANEENSSVTGVGIDELSKRGELDFLQYGPLYWVDSANSDPCIGTGGIMTWKMTATGKAFHSGFPHNGINAASLAIEAIRYIQHRFYMDFPHDHEDRNQSQYNFIVGSSLKPTGIHTPLPLAITQIPRNCQITGDIRFTPFYTVEEIKTKVNSYVKDLNEIYIRNNNLPTFGYESYVLEEKKENSVNLLQGLIEWEWTGYPMRGVAVNLNSLGYQAISDAIQSVRGSVKAFSLTGSLPIIADLQTKGFDVQIIGFGRMEAYHAVNEFAKLSEFKDGVKISNRIIAELDKRL